MKYDRGEGVGASEVSVSRKWAGGIAVNLPDDGDSLDSRTTAMSDVTFHGP